VNNTLKIDLYQLQKKSNYIWFDPIIIGIQEKRPNRNALMLCLASPLDLLESGLKLE